MSRDTTKCRVFLQGRLSQILGVQARQKLVDLARNFGQTALCTLIISIRCSRSSNSF